jgi:hypothetical protein
MSGHTPSLLGSSGQGLVESLQCTHGLALVVILCAHDNLHVQIVSFEV